MFPWVVPAKKENTGYHSSKHINLITERIHGFAFFSFMCVWLMHVRSVGELVGKTYKISQFEYFLKNYFFPST